MQPLLCLADDAQWLDSASARTLAFVARRLLAEKIAVVLATRELRGALVGLPALHVEPLGRGDARALLESILPAPLDERVLERIVAEMRGNPLGLLELPRGLTPTQLAGGFGLPSAVPLSARIEQSFMRRLARLTEDARRLLLVAAADPVGDQAVVWRAAERLGIEESAAHTVESEELLALSPRVLFRHPLVRSAVYGAAGPNERREVHRALAEATDAETDPDRRVWHRARAASVPDEDVAAELERSAARAQARGGFAAAAAFRERAVALTPEAGRRAERALAAAQAHLQAGAFAAALQLLAGAEPGLLDELGRAHVELLRGQIDFASSAGSEAPALLLKAARGIEPLDITLARETYLDAWVAAFFAGGFARVGTLQEISRAARSAPNPPQLRARPTCCWTPSRFWSARDGPRRRPCCAGHSASLPRSKSRSQKGCGGDGWPRTSPGRCGTIRAGIRRSAGTCRPSARPAYSTTLPVYLQTVGANAAWRGDFATAVSLIAEADTIAEATGNGLARYAAVVLECFRGREAEARALIEVEMTKASAAGQGYGIQVCRWVSAVMHVGLGRYEDALAEARQASEEAPELWTSGWALSEVIEAATRTGKTKSPAKRWSGWPRRRASARTIGVWASSLVHGRCSAMARPPRARIARRSSD